MSVRIETLSAETVTVHRVERGEELVEDYEDTVVTGEVALALSYDEVVSIEGTEEQVNDLAARMLAAVPGGEYVPVHRDTLAELESLARDLECAAEADTDSLADMADSLEIAHDAARIIRALLQR